MNELEAKLGLVEKTPIQKAMEDPSAYTLKAVPKIKQTYELLVHVCNQDGLALKHAAKKLVCAELCEIAVKQNGLALEYIPDKVLKAQGVGWYRHICEKAVLSNCAALRCIPDELRDAEITEMAVMSDGGLDEIKKDPYIRHPIAIVPDELLTKELLVKAVSHFPACIRDIPQKRITKTLSKLAVSGDGLTLNFIPNKYVDAAMVSTATSENPMAIRYVPDHLMNQELCLKCFKANYATLGYIPSKYVTAEMCLHVIQQKRFAVFDFNAQVKSELFGSPDIILVLFDDIPEKLRKSHTVLDAIIKLYVTYGSYPILLWNEHLIEKKEKGLSLLDKRGDEIKPLPKKIIEYLTPYSKKPKETGTKVSVKSNATANQNWLAYAKQSIIPIQTELPQSYALLSQNAKDLITYDFSENDYAQGQIYYISDIHIEHQLKLIEDSFSQKSDDEKERYIIRNLSRKIKEMVKEIPEDRNAILLIGGDVADSVMLSEMFYNILREQWHGGTILSVLGNHELWDCDREDPETGTRSVETIVEDYRSVINRGWWCSRNNYGYDRPTSWNLSNSLYVNSALLENELYIRYQNRCSRIISEEEILNASIDDLKNVLSKCSFILLGGIGYSGLNPVYNSGRGLYRGTIHSYDDEIMRTKRFKDIHDKIRQCAEERRVIVLTHTPVFDWTRDEPVKNWIYINGHTHRNALSIPQDSAIVLSDNQIGYTPRKWKLNSFMIDMNWYDPFEQFSDGIYLINSDQYLEFNRGRGIHCTGCSYEGKIYMLKRDRKYMFLLQSAHSLCLLAGGQRKKLNRYDVQYYYDNMVSYCAGVLRVIEPYQNVLRKISKEIKAIGGTGRIHGCIVDISYYSHIYVNPFDGQLTPYWAIDIRARLPFNSIKLLLEKKEPQLMRKYLKEKGKQSIPLIGNYQIADDRPSELAVIPKWVLGTQIYEPSRIMKAIQYVWEQNVIRIWNDDILSTNALSNDKPLLE